MKEAKSFLIIIRNQCESVGNLYKEDITYSHRQLGLGNFTKIDEEDGCRWNKEDFSDMEEFGNDFHFTLCNGSELL